MTMSHVAAVSHGGYAPGCTDTINSIVCRGINAATRHRFGGQKISGFIGRASYRKPLSSKQRDHPFSDNSGECSSRSKKCCEVQDCGVLYMATGVARRLLRHRHGHSQAAVLQ